MLDEDSAIKALVSAAGAMYSAGELPLFDDAAAVKVGDSVLIIKIDGTSERYSRYGWMGLDDLVYRVLAAAATDVIAKGGRPEYVTVSVGIPPTYGLDSVRRIGEGIRDFLNACGATLLGGDTNASTEDLGVWVDAAVIGRAVELKPITGVVEGDTLCVTGCLGLSALPALTHYAGLDESVLDEKLKSALRRPRIPLNFLDMLGVVKASTDISDGLRSIRRMLELNGLSLELSEDLPLCPEVAEVMVDHGISAEEVLRYMGEEFIIAYVPREGVGRERNVVGRFVRGAPGVISFRGREVAGGWDNFRGYIGRT